MLAYDDFYTDDDQLTYDEKAFEKRLQKPAEAKELLTSYRERLAAQDPFTAAELESNLKAFVAERRNQDRADHSRLTRGRHRQGRRFGMFETLEILGKQRCLRRIDRTLAKLDED